MSLPFLSHVGEILHYITFMKLSILHVLGHRADTDTSKPIARQVNNVRIPDAST